MSTELEQIQISMEQAKKKVADYDALERLENNADFKLLFTDGYLKDYAIRLVGLKASVRMQDDRNQTFMGDQLNAIGHLTQYMLYVKQEGRVAKESIAVDSEEMEAIMQEQDEEGEK